MSATIYSKIKKTVKHTLIFGIGGVINSAFGFVLVPVYARNLRADQFGVLSLLTITLTLETIVLKFGLNHAFFRHYYETEAPAHRRRIVGSTLTFLLASASMLTVALWLLAPQIASLIFFGGQAKTDLSSRTELLRYVFLIGFFDIMTLVPESILRANFRSARYSALNITAFVAQLFFVAYLVIAVEASVKSVLLGRLAGVIFEAILFFIAVRRELSASFSAPELRGMLAFGVPLIFSQISFTLFMMIDRFFLERFSTSKEVGVYSMSNTLVSVVTVLVTVPFSQVWTAMRFSVMKEEGAEEYYSRVLTYIVFVSMFLALGVAAIAGDGLLLYGLKSYWSAAAIIPLLAFSSVLDSASRVLNVGITLEKRTIYAPLVIAAALVVNVGLNFLLIPAYGSAGATISTLISYIVFCALRYWASNLFYKVRYEWGRVFKIAAVGIILVAAFYLITSLYLDDFLTGEGGRKASVYLAMLIKAALALSFPLLLLGLRFYDERERQRLTEIRKKIFSMLSRRRWKEALMALLVFVGVMALLGCLAVVVASRHG